MLTDERTGHEDGRIRYPCHHLGARAVPGRSDGAVGGVTRPSAGDVPALAGGGARGAYSDECLGSLAELGKYLALYLFCSSQVLTAFF